MSESNSVWQNFNKSAGWVAIILLAYSLATMAILLVLGPPPTNAQYTLEMLHQNQLVGLLRLDVLTTLVMPLYYLLFFCLFISLRKSNELGAMITLLLGCAGLTLFLAAPSFVSWMALSKRFTMATTEAQKTCLLAAGETILATDLWHSSSGFVGGLLMQTSMVFISFIMLRSNNFSKWTAWIGLLTHILDLVHVLLMLILPSFGAILMAIGGTLYLVWFPLLARDFFRISK